MKNVLALTVFISCIFSGSLYAQNIGHIESVQLPAWLKRGNQLQALSISSQVQAGDTVITGKNSRAIIKLAEGSHIKLGEKANFRFQKAENNNVFTGLFKLASGAFRFATNALNKTTPRNIRIGIGNVTVGIRGTDIWGKADPDTDVLVLIEGQVEVSREGQTPVAMTEALSHYQLGKNQTIAQATPVDMDQLSLWAQETELQDNQATISESGTYYLYLMSLQSDTWLEANTHYFQTMGYPAEAITHTNSKGEEWRHIVIKNISSIEGAEKLKTQMEEQLGLSTLRYGRQ